MRPAEDSITAPSLGAQKRAFAWRSCPFALIRRRGKPPCALAAGSCTRSASGAARIRVRADCHNSVEWIDTDDVRATLSSPAATSGCKSRVIFPLPVNKKKACCLDCMLSLQPFYIFSFPCSQPVSYMRCVAPSVYSCTNETSASECRPGPTRLEKHRISQVPSEVV